MTRYIRLAVFCTTLFFSQIFTSSAEASVSGCLTGECYNGYGTYQYANGNRYVGNFAKGQPHGDGILYFANGDKYLGSWVRSWRQGKGRFIFAVGHDYLGQLHRNKFQGNGRMEYANGDRYEGAWAANQPNGFGQYFFKNGNAYKGEFADGRFHGNGTFYDGAGHATAGEWLNGRLQGGSVPENGESVRLEVSEAETLQEDHAPRERSADAAPSSSVRIWAVVVGVAEYTHMPALRFTDDDAYQFYAFLKSPSGGALPDEQLRVLVDDHATRYNILDAMRSTFLQADENDVILFYFSGHGIDGAFVPVDYDGRSNRLEHRDINRILQASKARHKVVLGDACHAGSLIGMSMMGEPLASRTAVDNILKKYYSAFEDSSGGLAFIMSSKGREVSLEDSGLRAGVFSYYLIEGLKGSADRDRDGIVNITELFEYTNAKVSGYTAGAQTPVITGEYDKGMPMSVVRPTLASEVGR